MTKSVEAFLLGEKKVCWNHVLVLFAALCALAMLSQRFVSVRNVLRLWHAVVWNNFPLAVLQCLLGPRCRYQLKEVLPFSGVDAALS